MAMKRNNEHMNGPRKLVLRRENIRVLDEDATRQVRGGLASKGSKPAPEQMAAGL